MNPSTHQSTTWQPEPRTDSNWIQTYTGRQFWPLDPQPEEIFIEDIAHALSNVCRYTGHCSEFYSVAEHSVRVSFQVQKLYLKEDCSHGRYERARIWALCGLLHDASEAYIADVSRPVKHSAVFGPIYKAIEANLERQINRRFDLPSDLPLIKLADNQLLRTEKRDLMANRPCESAWVSAANGAEPLQHRIEPWSPALAKEIFLYRFHALTSARKVAAL